MHHEKKQTQHAAAQHDDAVMTQNDGSHYNLVIIKKQYII
jgi:hypothetical protein